MSLQAIKAQAHIHHAYLLGLQLMISSRLGPDVMEDWMFRLFRRQHLDKFLSSFEKLGLSAEPDAVACAKYHVLSNSIGGVPVEYMAEKRFKGMVKISVSSLDVPWSDNLRYSGRCEPRIFEGLVCLQWRVSW
jgi:hypothetical protein